MKKCLILLVILGFVTAFAVAEEPELFGDVEAVELVLEELELVDGGQHPADQGPLYGPHKITKAMVKESLHTLVDIIIDTPRNLKDLLIEVVKTGLHDLIDKKYK